MFFYFAKNNEVTNFNKEIKTDDAYNGQNVEAIRKILSFFSEENSV